MNNSLNNQNLNKALAEDIKQLGNTEDLLLPLENTTTEESSGNKGGSENLLTVSVEAAPESLPKVAIDSSLDSKAPLAFKADFKPSITPEVSLLVELDTATATLPGARSATVGGEVFLGGNFIELGLSSLGDFGTLGSKPAGFFGTNARNNIGMSVDRDGFNVGEDLRADIFLPGNPEERFAVGYMNGGNTFTGSNRALNTFGEGNNDIVNSVTNTSSGDNLSAESLGLFNGALEIEQDISFQVDDKFFKNTVTLTNVSEEVLDSVRYMRSFDPDNTQDLGGDFDTINTIRGTVAEDGFAAVVAETLDGDSPIFLYSNDARARASYFGFTNTNPYASSAYDATPARGSSVTNDIGITMTFDVGALAVGESTTFTYFTSLDERTFEEVIEDLNEAPEAANDFAETDLDIPVTIDVLANDTDADDDVLEIVGFDSGSLEGGTISLDDHGTVDTSDDTLVYTPAAGFVGTDSFNYTISDGVDTAMASVEVTVNDIEIEAPEHCLCAPLNIILGDAGRNALNGTDYNDLIIGLQGRDILTGGAGKDQFVYTSIVDAGDIINDFEVGEDKIVLTDVLDSFGYSGTDPIADGYISFTSVGSSTIINLDPDGTSGSDAANVFLFAKDVTVGELNNLDNFIYTEGASPNPIIGTAGRDELNGTDDDDVIIGLQGRDTLMGGEGCDQFVYTSIVDAGDIINDFEVGEDKIVLTDVLDSFGYYGTDPIADGYISFTSVGSSTILNLDPDGTSGSDAANVFLFAKDVAVGELDDLNNFVYTADNSLNEVIGTAGRDALNGTNGNDLIKGLQGRDTLMGGAGCDQFVYTSIVDAGDIISDFEVGHDQIVLTDVLDSFGYAGSDPIADGYISFTSVGSSTILNLDPDGTDGSDAANVFLFAKDVTVAELNDTSNFVF